MTNPDRIERWRNYQLTTPERQYEDIEKRLARIVGAPHLGEKEFSHLGEVFTRIAMRLGSRANRALTNIRPGERQPGQFDDELKKQNEVEISFFVGAAGAGKSYVDQLLELWTPSKGGIETSRVTWEQAIAAGRASEDPDRRIETPPGIMLPEGELWMAGDYHEEFFWKEIVEKRSPSIGGELAPSSIIMHSKVNNTASMYFGKERGLRTVYNLLHKQGRFAGLPKEMKVRVNLIGIVAGFVPRYIMTCFRDDLRKIDPEDPHALEKASDVAAAYNKPVPTSLAAFIAMRSDGATYDQVEQIEVENNKVVCQIKTHQYFKWPPELAGWREEHVNLLFHALMSDENVRIPVRASHLDMMFTALGEPEEGIVLSTFVGINDPRLEELNLDLEKIAAMGDEKRRMIVAKAQELELKRKGV